MILCKKFLSNMLSISEENITEKENLEEYKIKFEYAGKALTSNIIKAIINSVDSCDDVFFNLQYSQDKISKCSSNTEIEEVIDDINSNLETERVTLLINVIKNKQDYISVYSCEKLFEYFDAFNFFDFFQFMNNIIHKNILHFKPLNENIELVTKTICFSNVKVLNVDVQRDYYIEKYRLVGKSAISFILHMIPCDFKIIRLTQNINYLNKTIDRFKKFEYILSLLYISNEAEVSENFLQFIFYGYKNIVIEYKNYGDNDINVNNTIIEICEWSYQDGNVVDKLGIVRNVLSINYNDDEFLSITDSEYQSIVGNYLLYLKKHVQDYLKLKETVTLRFQSFCDECADQISQLSSTLRKNFLALFGYLITVLLTKGISNSLSDIFSKEVTIISSFVLLGSFIVWIISFIYYCSQNNYIDKKIDKFREYYKDIITDNELSKIIDDSTLIAFTKERNKKLVTTYSVIWIVSLIIIFLVLDALSGSVKLLYFVNIF